MWNMVLGEPDILQYWLQTRQNWSIRLHRLDQSPLQNNGQIIHCSSTCIWRSAMHCEMQDRAQVEVAQQVCLFLMWVDPCLESRNECTDGFGWGSRFCWNEWLHRENKIQRMLPSPAKRLKSNDEYTWSITDSISSGDNITGESIKRLLTEAVEDNI
jgi:hypothetical protein